MIGVWVEKFPYIKERVGQTLAMLSRGLETAREKLGLSSITAAYPYGAAN